MEASTQLHFKEGPRYDERIEISINLVRNMTAEDYKTVVEAANTILETTRKYVVAQPVGPEEE